MGKRAAGILMPISSLPGPLITKKVPGEVTGTFFAQLFRYMADILNMWQLYISVLNS